VVALERYNITKVLRGILKGHFEHFFHSLENVNSAVQKLMDVAEGIKATIQTLFRSRHSSVSTNPTLAVPDCAGVADQKRLGTVAEAWDRVWNFHTCPGDQEVLNFFVLSQLLLHLMIHKAYCLLYFPLIRESSMGMYASIRSR
jgi:hypothetical protein